MFENLKNLTSMLGQARAMREKMEQMQAELARKTVEGEAGAGAVRVTVNGKLEVVAVRLDPSMLKVLAGEGEQADQRMIEDLIAGATNAGLEKAKEMVQEEMRKLTGGLNIPGLDKMLEGGM